MTEDKKLPSDKKTSPDWFVRGVLIRLGEMFDRFTGRNWKPASSLATSEIIEKLKTLLDSEAENSGEKGIFVPHHITLKMQWDKFSTDADSSLKKLEDEFLIAAVDHINDHRYHTYAPLRIEIKPDYFTEGVKLSASFDRFRDENEAEINLGVPDLKNVVLVAPQEKIAHAPTEDFDASFVVGSEPKKVRLIFTARERKTVGRTRENDLWLDDPGVSKLHAALVLGVDGQLMVADTGSTNGTFVNEERIAYGKAMLVGDGGKVRFGTVEVEFERILKPVSENAADGQNLSVEENSLTETDSESAANTLLGRRKIVSIDNSQTAVEAVGDESK